MKLIYNTLDLATLGTLRIIGRSTRREPVEAPQRERIEYRIRLDFFESSFQANFNQIQQLQAQLATNNATLLWSDDSGAVYENRPVTAGDDSVPADVMVKGGTYQQAIEFTFWFYNHQVTASTLNGTWLGAGGAAQDLGAVESWSERLGSDRFEALRDARKLVTGTVSCSGRWQGDTTVAIASRRPALLAKKDALLAALVATANGVLSYGTFNQVVRVMDFKADVNQPNNYLAWTATFSFTRYPNEQDYALLQYTLTPKLNLTDGIRYLTLAGKIQGPSEAQTRSRLGVLTSAIIPGNFQESDVQTSAATVGSESTGGAGDGETFTELTFTLVYRDNSTITLTLTGTGGAAVNLGTVDRFKDAAQITRFSDMRDVRKRSAGLVTLAGKWFVPDALSPSDQQAALTAQYEQFMSALNAQAAGQLVYGGIFNQVVRVTEFTPELDRLTNCISWTLAAAFTRYPNELDYALLEYTLAPRLNFPEGITYLTLAGRIQSENETAARKRLATLQAAAGLVPSGYVLQSVQTSAATVGSESNASQGDLSQSDGLTFTELSFTIEYRDTSALPATYQNLGGGGSGLFQLGTVDKFKDSTAVTRFDDLRNQRKRSAGTVALSGKWYVGDNLTTAQQQAALTAQKQAMDAQVVNGDNGRLIYAGIFNQIVRITEFSAEINRLTNCIEWTLAATFTRYPNEADYTLMDLRVQSKLNTAEGIAYMTLSGKVQAPTQAAATARLLAQAAAVVPGNFVTLETDLSPATVVSESNVTAGGAPASDGTAFIEVSFTLSYRDTGTIPCTYQRSGANAPQVNLGTVDKFASRQVTTLFDAMRSVRKRAEGTATLSGKWYAADNLSAAAKQAQLTAQLATLAAELALGAAGQLIYGGAFNQVVRVLDFNPQINRLNNCIEWSLTGTYTSYPNESDYAYAEMKVATKSDLASGTVMMSLAGTIGAQSPEAAYAKLALLRTTFIPSGFVLLSDDTDERRVSADSGVATTGQNQGDGDAFIELTVNDTWQMATANILEWSLRTSVQGDINSSTQRTVYSGTVRAQAGDQPSAFLAATQQAAALGDGKAGIQMRSNITSLDRFFQTPAGSVFVTVDFSYEYETQGTTTWLEVTSTLAADNYGNTTETASGYVAAPSLALAATAYQAQVRGLLSFKNALILSERTPTLSQMTQVNADNSVATLFQRYDFNLAILRPKAASSIRYDLVTTPNFNTMELSTTMQGTVWGSTQAVAEAFLQTTLSGLNLTGKKVVDNRTPHTRSGPLAGGAGAATVFESMDFSITNISLFTGVAGILECEASEEFSYSGMRNVEKPIPDGPSIVQQCGTTLGVHTVTARCRATTATAALVWVKGLRTALLQSLNSNTNAYEEPVRIVTKYGFLPQTTGVVSGGGANVAVYEASATFSEKIPELTYS